MIDAAQFLRIRMNMDEFLLRHGNIEQRIGLRRHFGHASANHQHQIGLLDPRFEFRVGANTDLAGIIRVIP